MRLHHHSSEICLPSGLLHIVRMVFENRSTVQEIYTHIITWSLLSLMRWRQAWNSLYEAALSAGVCLRMMSTRTGIDKSRRPHLLAKLVLEDWQHASRFCLPGKTWCMPSHQHQQMSSALQTWQAEYSLPISDGPGALPAGRLARRGQWVHPICGSSCTPRQPAGSLCQCGSQRQLQQPFQPRQAFWSHAGRADWWSCGPHLIIYWHSQGETYLYTVAFVVIPLLSTIVQLSWVNVIYVAWMASVHVFHCTP